MADILALLLKGALSALGGQLGAPRGWDSPEVEQLRPLRIERGLFPCGATDVELSRRVHSLGNDDQT